MDSRRDFLLVMLALGVMFLPGAAAAEGIQRSVDQQGTIHIGKPGPASEKMAGEVKAPSGPVAPNQGPPPGFTPPKTRRPYGPEAEARRKAFREAHPPPPPRASAPKAPAPKAPPTQLEQPGPPEPPQGK